MNDTFLSVPIPAMIGSELIITPGLNVRIKHPDCQVLAYVSTIRDEFYCSRCAFRGRVSEIFAAPGDATEGSDQREAPASLV